MNTEDEKWRKEAITNMNPTIAYLESASLGTMLKQAQLFETMSDEAISFMAMELMASRRERRELISQQIAAV